MNWPTSKCFWQRTPSGSIPYATSRISTCLNAYSRSPAIRIAPSGTMMSFSWRRERLAELVVVPQRRRQRALPERPAHDRGVLDEPALDGLQRVEPRRQQAWTVSGSSTSSPLDLVGEPARHLLREERVAARALGDRVDGPLARRRRRQQQRRPARASARR